jgi:BolA protein
MPVRDAIVAKLSAKFVPDHLEVIDESSRHQGHAGSRPEGETHFRVRIAAKTLQGLSRVAQHRAINDTLADELSSGVHALAIEVSAPGSPQAGSPGTSGI